MIYTKIDGKLVPVTVSEALYGMNCNNLPYPEIKMHSFEDIVRARLKKERGGKC